MIVTTRELFEKARAGGYAVGSFNVSTLEAIKGVIDAAVELNAPVMIETSEKEMHYVGAELVAEMIRTIATDLPIPVAIHLDHGQSLDSAKEAIAAGYTSVHVDGSALEYEANLKLTKEVVAFAHSQSIPVEGELGHVGGASEIHNKKSKMEKATYTDPTQAAVFVHETGIDSFASSIGNIHGIYENEPSLDFERLEKIDKIGLPLALHGGSGIPEDQIKRAISLGVTKINVNTELRQAYTETLHKELDAHPEEIVPYKYLPAEIEAVKQVVMEKIRMFGSVNQA
jgi:fructose-bisphosphate aldolase class II